MIHYDIQKISTNYKKQGKEAINKARTVFETYHIPLQQATPTSLFFIPQPALAPGCGCALRGNMTWNSLSRTISVRYYLDFTNIGADEIYSRFLKWYLVKWNEKHTDLMKKNNISFIYPGQSGASVILQAQRRIRSGTMEKILPSILFQMNNIAEAETDTIKAILTGQAPARLKKEFLDDIHLALQEVHE